jgi:hypothetical protein
MSKNYRKKAVGLVAGFISCAMIVCTLPVANVRAVDGQETGTDKIIYVGDVDGDGAVTPKDVTKMRRFLAGGWDVEVATEDGDVDGDGSITPKDVTKLRRYLAGGWGVELPEKIITKPVATTITAANFPDDIFRKFVSDNFDKDGDGILSVAEIVDVKEINCRPHRYTNFGNDLDDGEIWEAEKNFSSEGNGIKSIQGIEFFTELELINCHNNRIEKVDLSKNKKLREFYSDGNCISKLIAGDSRTLTIIGCENNNLTEIDVSGLKNLKGLDCRNNQIASINCGTKPNLIFIDCGGNNITTIDISNCPLLKELKIGSNELKSLDVSRNTDLELLWCDYNQIESLDVSNNTKLWFLGCHDNPFKTGLDVSKNTALTQLECQDNQLKDLNISNNTLLEILDCGGNELTTFEAGNNTSLKELKIGYNKLSSLDLSKNTALELLWCDGNPLTSIDLSKTKVTGLKLRKNEDVVVTWQHS